MSVGPILSKFHHPWESVHLKIPGSETFRGPPQGIYQEQSFLGKVAESIEAMKNDRHDYSSIKGKGNVQEVFIRLGEFVVGLVQSSEAIVKSACADTGLWSMSIVLAYP